LLIKYLLLILRKVCVFEWTKQRTKSRQSRRKMEFR